MNAPFHGLRVVDVSDRFSGAFAARLFGDFGAEVILAEPPEGHALRCEPPFLNGVSGEDRSTVHAYVNWNKRSIVINHEDELADLIRSADVVITTSDSPPRPPLSGVGTKVQASTLMLANSKPLHLPFTPGEWPRCITTRAVPRDPAVAVAEAIQVHSGNSQTAA